MYPQPPVAGWSRVGLKNVSKTTKIDMSCNSEQFTRYQKQHVFHMLDIQAGASGLLLHAMGIPHINCRFRSPTFGLIT